MERNPCIDRLDFIAIAIKDRFADFVAWLCAALRYGYQTGQSNSTASLVFTPSFYADHACIAGHLVWANLRINHVALLFFNLHCMVSAKICLNLL